MSGRPPLQQASKLAGGAEQQIGREMGPQDMRLSGATSREAPEVVRDNPTLRNTLPGAQRAHRIAQGPQGMLDPQEMLDPKSAAFPAAVSRLAPHFGSLADEQLDTLVCDTVGIPDERQRANAIAATAAGWAHLTSSHRDTILAAAGNIRDSRNRAAALTPLGRGSLTAMTGNQQLRWADAVICTSDPGQRLQVILNTGTEALTPAALAALRNNVLATPMSSPQLAMIRNRIFRHLGSSCSSW